jgi:hypothetical protein
MAWLNGSPKGDECRPGNREPTRKHAVESERILSRLHPITARERLYTVNRQRHQSSWQVSAPPDEP